MKDLRLFTLNLILTKMNVTFINKLNFILSAFSVKASPGIILV